MRNFNLEDECESLYSKEIVDFLTIIHEYRGKQQLYIETEPEILDKLVEIAKIKSTVSSNRIEGIQTSDKRIKELLDEKAEPKNRDEQEIQGYRYVLDQIHTSYEFMDVKPNIILQLHRDLYYLIASSFGGKYKATQNSIVETDENGIEHERFKPLSPFETSEAMENLCNSYNKCVEKELVDPLILIPVFILDFLCIHPFNDGNGRMSRLLTLLLLYKSQFMVGKYISLEMLIENNKNDYYRFLQDSSADWHENKNNYAPFVKYYLGVILAAYRDFEKRTEHLKSKKKPIDRIRSIFDSSFTLVTKSMIQEKCPDIPVNMIEFHLKTLMNEKYIIKVAGGRYASYIKNKN